MNYNVGDIVVSVQGRDIGERYIVLGFADDKVLVVNGKIRKISAPKKKNPKHIVLKNNASVYECLLNERVKYNDALVRKILKFEENL